ncbi:hypothetical protein [Endozoicomonas acroporae]|uniref:hypothetical protein n=1 Tax=Endozoicomonas acroporae TaxID=1701104 RepID=UPI0011AFC34C|nr:hypothetical protein [Endozoicomonas acroporae]
MSENRLKVLILARKKDTHLSCGNFQGKKPCTGFIISADAIAQADNNVWVLACHFSWSVRLMTSETPLRHKSRHCP